jgi:hypothetical protein
MQRIVTAFMAFLALTFGFVAVTTTPAAAADGRAVSAQGEIRAVLYHAFDRNPDGPQPDRHSVPYYMVGVKNLGCQWGISDATFKMLTSAEAQNRWHHNAQDLAGMLYAALLDRAPDPGGLRTYTSAIQVYSLNWATRQMMGSAEYRTRLARICNASGLSAAMFDWETAWNFARNTLLDRAKVNAIACGQQKAVDKIVGWKDNPKPGPAILINASGEIAKILQGWLEDSCRAAVTYVEAAASIALHTMDGADGHNAVFIRIDTHKSWLTGHMVTYFSIIVGPNPTQWHNFEGKAVSG